MNEEDAKVRAQISSEVFDPAGAPPVVEAPPVDEPSKLPVAAAVETPVDEWAGVSPALRATVEGLKTKVGEVDTLQFRLKQAEQRLGAATNELSELKKRPEPEPQEHASVRNLREGYPELSVPLEERIAAVRAEVLEKMPAIDQKSLAETIAKTIKADIAFDIAVDRVEEAHPGWQQEKETPEFRGWQKTASPEVQKLAMSPRAADAIKMLDAYHEFKKTQKSSAEIEAARLKRLEQSQATQGRKLPAAKAESDMTEAELRAHIAAQVFT